MSTNQFLGVLFLSALIEAVVLAICVPVVMAVRTRLAVSRAQALKLQKSARWDQDAEALLGDIYAAIKGGSVVAPQDIEDRVLDVYSEGNNTYHKEIR